MALSNSGTLKGNTIIQKNGFILVHAYSKVDGHSQITLNNSDIAYCQKNGKELDLVTSDSNFVIVKKGNKISYDIGIPAWHSKYSYARAEVIFFPYKR